MSNDNFSGTPATLTGEEISPQLYRTLDAAEMAGIKAAENRTARKIFLKIADRLKLSPADERREEKGGSPQKFWTPAQVEAVKAAYTPPTVTLADRVARIKKLSADVQRGVIEIGKNLAACKAEIGHGNWAKWLEENFQWNIRTAQRLIAVAERFANTTTLSHLNASTLQAMLALPQGTEQEFIDAQAAVGRPIETQTARQVQKAVKAFKARQKSADAAPVIDIADAVIAPAADVTQQIDSAEDSATVIEPAQDSEPATVIDRVGSDNLRDVFKLILEVNDADKLRRIRDFVDARLAAISAEDSVQNSTTAKISPTDNSKKMTFGDWYKQNIFDETEGMTFGTLVENFFFSESEPAGKKIMPTEADAKK